MPRIKYFNKDTEKWEYADSYNGVKPDEAGNADLTDEEYAALVALLEEE